MPKKQNKDMNKFVLAGICFLTLLFLTVFYNFQSNITGFVGRDIYVYINETMAGKLTAFDYAEKLNPGEIQNITAEFANIGTSLYNASIEETLYMYENGGLNETGYYYDYESPMYPGGRKFFKTYYVPFREGIYYIKLIVRYGYKTLRTWGVFIVGTIPSGGNVTPGGGGGGGGIGGGAVSPIIKFAEREKIKMDLEYPKIIDMYQGQQLMTGVKVKNTGNKTLHYVRFYISSPETIDISINPKEIYEIDINETSMFLLSIHVMPEALEGVHLINFEVTSEETRETGLIQINVTTLKVAMEKEAQDRILNNWYLIIEMEREILVASKKGTNTTLAEEALNKAKDHLDAAENYLNLANLDEAFKELDKKDENLEDAVFKLAQESFRVYYPPAFSPFWLLLIAILMGFIFLLIERRRKKKVKKPKLLRRAEESEI